MSRRWSSSLRVTVVSAVLAVSGGTLLAFGVGLAPPASADTLCGAPANTLGFNYCGDGVPVTKANLPAAVCSTFDCIENFSNGTGYMVACKDGAVSLSGGTTGACSGHGGVDKKVYLSASAGSATTAPHSPATIAPPGTTTPVVATTVASPVIASSGSGALAFTGVGLSTRWLVIAGMASVLLGGALFVSSIGRRPSRR